MRALLQQQAVRRVYIMGISEALEQSRPGMIKEVETAINQRQLNNRTQQTYLHWITRFVLFHGLKDPDELADEDRQQFLAYLKDRIPLSRARMNQASQALAFFYEDVLKKPAIGNTAAA
jgi:hypothetical protein